eukprot:jgi/Bigna1/75006/fgenesh1_pg.32_\
MSTLDEVEEHIRQTEAFLKQESEIFTGGKWRKAGLVASKRLPRPHTGSGQFKSQNVAVSRTSPAGIGGVEGASPHRVKRHPTHANSVNRINPFDSAKLLQPPKKDFAAPKNIKKKQKKGNSRSKLSLLESFDQEGPFNIVPTPEHSSGEEEDPAYTNRHGIVDSEYNGRPSYNIDDEVNDGGRDNHANEESKMIGTHSQDKNTEFGRNFFEAYETLDRKDSDQLRRSTGKQYSSDQSVVKHSRYNINEEGKGGNILIPQQRRVGFQSGALPTQSTLEINGEDKDAGPISSEALVQSIIEKYRREERSQQVATLLGKQQRQQAQQKWEGEEEKASDGFSDDINDDSMTRYDSNVDGPDSSSSSVHLRSPYIATASLGAMSKKNSKYRQRRQRTHRPISAPVTRQRYRIDEEEQMEMQEEEEGFGGGGYDHRRRYGSNTIRAGYTSQVGGEVAHPASSSSSSSKERVTNRYSKSEIARKVAEERSKQLTFRPQINTNYNSTKSRPSDPIERIEQIQNDYLQRIEERSKLKKREQDESFQKLPFKPNVRSDGNSNKGSGGGKNKRGKGVPVEDRLLEHANDKISQRMRMKKQLEEKRIKECTFSPHISINSRRVMQQAGGGGDAPIHRRLGALEKEKQIRLLKLRKEKYNDENLRFAPKINDKSKTIVEKKRKGVEAALPVEDRLRSKLGTNILKKMMRQEQVERELSAELTFGPKLSENSKRIVQEKFQGREKGFYDRQLIYEDIKQEKLKAKRAHAINQHTYNPNIGNSEEVLENSRAKRYLYQYSDREDIFERLAFKDSEDLKESRVAVLVVRSSNIYALANRLQLEREVYSGLNFKPEINEVSRELVRGKERDIYDLVYDESREQAQEEAKELAEERLLQDCTFKPNIEASKSSKWRAPVNRIRLNGGSEDLLKQIERKKAAREGRLQRVRAAKEYEEAKECTFEPETTKKRVKQPTGPVLIRGMARFMQTKQLAKQLEKEKKMREDKAFNVTKRASRSRNKPYTIPKPFKLSKNIAQKKKKRNLEKALRAKDSKTCTFRPQTLERTNRRILKQILDHPY